MKTPTGTLQGLPASLKMLADPTRLRILALLELEELAVGELARALDLAQSRVSNHLRVLRSGGLLAQRRAGNKTLLRLELREDGTSLPEKLFRVLRGALEEVPEHGADRVRLEIVLAERETDDDLFDRIAGEWDKFAGAFSTGRARERAGLHLLPNPFVAADLGCGTGTMAESLLPCTSKLILVDRSEAMLREAAKRLERRAGRCSLDFRQGSLDALPIEEAELDGCVAGMVLHHMPDLDPALSEMHRVLRPGGTASVLELAPHGETWMRRELGDLHLGLPAEEVLAAFERAGFEDLVLDPVEDRYCPRRTSLAESPAGTGADDSLVSLSLYLVRGRRPHEPTQHPDR